MRLDDTRVTRAAKKGEDAFWSAVARSLPEIRTGDVDPMSQYALEQAMKKAVREWWQVNYDERRSVASDRPRRRRVTRRRKRSRR